jgi:hypothetical protein
VLNRAFYVQVVACTAEWLLAQTDLTGTFGWRSAREARRSPSMLDMEDWMLEGEHSATTSCIIDRRTIDELTPRGLASTTRMHT